MLIFYNILNNAKEYRNKKVRREIEKLMQNLRNEDFAYRSFEYDVAIESIKTGDVYCYQCDNRRNVAYFPKYLRRTV